MANEPKPEAQLTPEQMQARIQELEADKAAQLAKIADLETNPTSEEAAFIKKVKDTYKVKDGEEGFDHVLILQEGGTPLPLEVEKAVVKAFDPHQTKSISKLPGYRIEIIKKAKK